MVENSLLVFAIFLLIYIPMLLKKYKEEKEIKRINHQRMMERYQREEEARALYMRRLSMSDINEIDRMDGYQFETYLVSLFERLGYVSNVTQSSGDFGADLILYAENRKIVVQVKRYTGTVGVSSVQEIASAKAYYDAHEAWVVTNSSFSKPAYQLANANDVLLLDRMELIKLSAQANEKHDPNFGMVRMK
ncbi:restriction endonuclease [Bacillus paramycoides]|uniref:restriction endonuclease n=1 Tax=Bacillus paramycoides TaxID=2026194 RepID=UPI002E202935|nr:restriction endonuclease [Bacillus paramycoides]